MALLAAEDPRRIVPICISFCRAYDDLGAVSRAHVCTTGPRDEEPNLHNEYQEANTDSTDKLVRDVH